MFTYIMSYKKLSQHHWDIFARLLVIKDILTWLSYKAISIKYKMSRNTVTTIKSLFDRYCSREANELLLSWKHLSIDEINSNFNFLISKSRRPHNIRWLPPNYIEKNVIREFKKHWFWYKRMFKHLTIKWIIPKYIKIYTIKGIYKRNNLLIKNVKSHNREHIPIYNYTKLSPFQNIHYDVKEILDQWALPKEIYDKFNLNPNLPIYERNIIDAFSRFRFIAYSNSRNATFWFYFLQFVLMFIRYCWIDYIIYVWMDNWTEFTSGSERKLNERNSFLQYLNVKINTYHKGHDVRKNLIERSHKSDDEEFFVPRGYYISDKSTFLKEAHWYMHYRNTERVHTGINMDTTPYKKLQQSGCFMHKRLLEFPTLILDDCIWDLMYHSKTISVVNALNSNSIPFDNNKSYIDFQVNFNIFNNEYAQNVLHHYLILLNGTKNII